MDIGRAFSFIFKDPSWFKKILILALLFLVPIIGWLMVGGYTLRLLKNVIDGVDQPLPEWDDWGGDLAGGFKAFLVGLIWGIPIWILTFVLNLGDSFILGAIAWLISVGWSAVTMSAMGDLARRGDIGDAFNARVIKRVTSNIPLWLVYILGAFVFSLFALIGLIGLIIGVIFTGAIAIAASTHLGGQAYRLSEGESAPVAPRF